MSATERHTFVDFRFPLGRALFWRIASCIDAEAVFEKKPTKLSVVGIRFCLQPGSGWTRRFHHEVDEMQILGDMNKRREYLAQCVIFYQTTRRDDETFAHLWVQRKTRIASFEADESTGFC